MNSKLILASLLLLSGQIVLPNTDSLLFQDDQGKAFRGFLEPYLQRAEEELFVYRYLYRYTEGGEIYNRAFDKYFEKLLALGMAYYMFHRFPEYEEYKPLELYKPSYKKLKSCIDKFNYNNPHEQLKVDKEFEATLKLIHETVIDLIKFENKMKIQNS